MRIGTAHARVCARVHVCVRACVSVLSLGIDSSLCGCSSLPVCTPCLGLEPSSWRRSDDEKMSSTPSCQAVRARAGCHCVDLAFPAPLVGSRPAVSVCVSVCVCICARACVSVYLCVCAAVMGTVFGMAHGVKGAVHGLWAGLVFR